LKKHARWVSTLTGFLGSDDDRAYDFSAQVTSLSTRYDAIVVERPMYFNYGGAWTGGHDVVGYTP
jgi:hypothetical protein